MTDWIGVVLPSGRLTAAQMEGLAKAAAAFGDGDIRLTVWQNLLLSGVHDDSVAQAEAYIAALGLATKATPIRAGLVSCTGNTGCKFAASDTKGTAEAIATHVESRLMLDGPVNIHLTGCHHSCAQHYISDIGLIGARVPGATEDDTVEGYHLFTGGGFGPDADIGQEVYRDVKAEDAPRLMEFDAIEDVVYGYKDGLALTMDILTPKTGAKGIGIVLVSSGGWRSSKSNVPGAELEGRKAAAAGRAADAGTPSGSPFLEGTTVTVAGAALLQRVATAVTKAGGNVLSSQLDVQGAHAKAGFVSMVANCELDQSALQALLYDLEAGMPFLFIDQLDIQVATAGEGKLRFLLGVSGQWQGAK